MKPKLPSDAVVDHRGKILDGFSSEDVKRFAQRSLHEGTVLAAVIQAPDLSVQFYHEGGPSLKMLKALEQAVEGYRAVLKNNKL